ncbi:MAG TPA: heme ABC transporter permease CcmC [Nitrospiria bacterium]
MSKLLKWLRRFEGWFGLAAAACILTGLYLGLVHSPPDYYQGEVVRIMYIHVPFASSSLLAYSVLTITSIWYLWKRDPIIDNMAHASAGIAVLFTSVALFTGSIWGKPTWNTWWTWDPKLISYSIMFLILVGYLMLRTFIDDRDKESRYAAVLAIVGAVDLPIVKFSAEWWRTLHQPLSISPRGSSIAGPMLHSLLFMMVGISLLFTYMVMVRTQKLYLQYLLEAKKGRLLGEIHQ